MTLRRYAPLKPSAGTKPIKVAICAQCGAEYRRWDHGAKYCSRRCEADARTLPRPTCHVCGVQVSLGAQSCIRHHWAAKRAPRQRTCAQCRQPFIPYPSQVLRQAAKFCSRACYNASVADRPARIPVTCLRCGVTFQRTRAAVARVQRTFCSDACLRTYNQGDRHPAWRGGHDPNRGPGWLRIAESIRQRDGYRCRRCGKTQADNGQKLSVDHIIPWRTFNAAAEANQDSNLAALCRSCHGHKAAAENRWLKGDVLDMWRYQVAVSQPWVGP